MDCQQSLWLSPMQCDIQVSQFYTRSFVVNVNIEISALQIYWLRFVLSFGISIFTL